MKKYLAVFLAAVCLLMSLAACGDDGQAPAPSQSAQPTQSAAPSEAPDAQPEETPGTDDAASGGILVVYFSATGSTKAVAETIAETAGGDLFEITPAQPYTSDDLNWRNEDSRVCREHDNPALQTVELTVTTPDNWADYDTVFIGYPIWWQNASWVVASFAAANDFEGKTVIPFCTSSSSGFGDSGKNLAAAANGGEWQEGQRFQSSVSSSDVVEWVNGLNLDG